MSDTTEELIPFLLPDDAEGYSWSLRYMTKEEAEKTIAMNVDNYCRDSMSKEIIESNYQCVVDMGYEEELKDYVVTKGVVSVVFDIVLIGFLIIIIHVLFVMPLLRRL